MVYTRRFKLNPVLNVGCLIQTGENRWMLINATEPVRPRDSFKKIEKELKNSQELPSVNPAFG